ncbi:MAG: hypothetical protein WAO35_03710, partial [Terriglobia bacterium]
AIGAIECGRQPISFEYDRLPDVQAHGAALNGRSSGGAGAKTALTILHDITEYYGHSTVQGCNGKC